MFWPVVNITLFTGIVPLRYGNLFLDVFNYVWSVGLGHMTNRKLAVAAKAEPKPVLEEEKLEIADKKDEEDAKKKK
jgi:hypothetical protein